MLVKRLFGELSDSAVADLSPDGIAVLPVGAIEQHGPHLPMTTDLVVAEAVARETVREFGTAHDLWQLPGLRLAPATRVSAMDDLGRRLAQTPLRKLVFLSGHTDNMAVLGVCAKELRLTYGLSTFVVDASVPGDDLGANVHGGRDETAIMLHVRPDLVDMSLAEAVSGSRRARADGLSFDGTFRDPTLATPEHGDRIFRRMLTCAGEALFDIAAFAHRPLPH
jgi:creatinine amidohydrolase